MDGLSVDEVLKIDYRLACRSVDRHDYFEGVRALLIDKDQKPRWEPARLEDVTDAMIDGYFKPLGPLGYLLGVFVRVVQLRRRPFALRCDSDPDWDERLCLFLSFNNSKYTGGTMLIAPHSDPADGLIEYVRWGPIGRLGLIRMLPRLYDGTHVNHPLASRRPVRRVEFDLREPVDVMIDGEIAKLQVKSLDILPAALDVYI